MDSVAEFLEQLSTKNIKLSVSDGAVHCYAPRGALTAEIESGIVFHKNRIIELFKLKSIQNNVNASNELLVKRDSDGYSKSQDLDRAIPKEYPLSVGQKGMLFIQNLHPEMSAYNVPICLRFAGSVDREKLSQAWNLVLKKYPILNSRIREDQGDYIQAIAPSGNHNLVVSVQQEDGAVMTDRMVKDTEIPFNVIDDFLYRITLYSTGNEVSYLLIVVHHLIVDGVSSVLIIQSLVDFYTRLLDFKKINIEPKNGYPDYVRWEQAMLGSKAGKDHERYWQKQLEGQQSVLDIFRVGGLKAGSSYIGKTHVCPLPDTLVELALGFSKKYKIELSALFLSIFQIIIHRYSQEDRIYIGMPVMTRPGDIFAFDVGYYVNMIPLLSVMSRDVRVLDQIRKCQATLLEGLYHSQYPFPLMVEKCSSVKNTKNPIFQVSYAYQNFMDVLPDFDSSSTNSCGISLVESVAQQGDYDLNLEVYQKEGNFSFHYKYNPDVCPESSVVRFAQQYISLFERLLNNPDAFVSDFSLASNDDIYSLLHLSKGVTVTSGPFTCIQDLIDQQALATPDNTAAVYEGQQVTYNHLLEQSDLLATYLQYFGVANDTVVGICMTQSPDVLVSILAVLKAGGAFLPLDPEYPDDRLAYMLEDSGVRLVLTQQCLHHKVRLFSLDSTDVVLVDSHLSKIRAQVSSLGLSLERRVSENQLAYVIYTSGSTGKPKAVGVRHRNLVNHNNFATAHYNLTCSDNQFQFSNHGFDLFVEEIFVALNSGATLVFEKKDLLLDLENLAELIRQHHITVLNVPTAFFHALADAQLIASGLKKIIVGGEKLDREKTLRFLANHPGVEMHNTYGPTETTIVSASCIVDKDLLKKHHSIPIGRPINNTRIYILDNNLQLVPRNIAGELYIAGDGVSKGYINRPELTAEKFIDNPFEPGSVMYRTGDLGRWLDDGNIEYLGRIDTQIKIRGFRVELGEIESRLNTYK
ncbi:amino acid adenylation domain-containing protein, partial [Teredinibacter turnerae]|uniref:non-ribosomal peptide synthetase n=1 Tax=Teredinibacter turnerae TaxID=2426 RepID=UPI000AD61C2B